MKSVFLVALVATYVISSLLTFPSHVTWMLGSWILVASWAALRDRPMWPWLVGCLFMLFVKQPGYTWAFWILTSGLTLFTVFDLWWRFRKSEPQNSRWRPIACALLICAVLLFGWSRWRDVNTSRQHSPDHRAIVCLGDSLTDYGYPQELEKLVALPIADFGVDGITTDQGIKMIPEILAVDPQLVVIELGGHDYNGEHKTRAEVGENLETLISAFKNRNILVVLVEIPRGFISDPYHGIERELAARHDLQLVEDSIIRNFIFFSPIVPPGMWLAPDQHYSDDGLHPNERGNRYFAEVVSRALDRVFVDSIRRIKP